MNDYNFGNFVCMLREKKGLTQAEIAQQLGVTPAAVSKWENGSSKPRVEILFQLANILEVKPEELMAGNYIVEEPLEPNVIKQINERYEYLRRIDSFATSKVKFRRILAFLIDWNIIGFGDMFLLFICSMILNLLNVEPNSTVHLLSLFSVIMLYPILFVLRDFITKGRFSIGKRITGLIVLDKTTGNIAKPSKLLVRNLFLFIMQIDAIILLFSGESIGDRMSHTVTVLKKDFDNDSIIISEPNTQTINTYVAPKPPTKKKLVITIATIVSVIVLFGVILAISVTKSLNEQKNTEEYKLAYNYLIESSVYEELNISEDEIKLTSCQVNTTYNINGNKQKTTEFGFSLSGVMVYVTCHYEDDAWYVCTECTKFK